MCISGGINDLLGAASLPAVYLCIPADFSLPLIPVCRSNLRLFLYENRSRAIVLVHLYGVCASVCVLLCAVFHVCSIQ